MISLLKSVIDFYPLKGTFNMENNLSTRKIHPLILFLMSIIFVVAIFFKIAIMKLVLLYFVLLPYLFQNNENVKQNLKKVFYIITAVSMLVLLKIIYSHDSNLVIREYALRLFFLFSISMLTFMAVDFDKVFVYLMASKKLKVTWGYSLLLAMNSLQLLKREQERIVFNARLRNLKWHQRHLALFSILVFAIRHSERGAMALVTRGLNADKLFYNVIYPTKRDIIILISYFLLTLTFYLVG